MKVKIMDEPKPSPTFEELESGVIKPVPTLDELINDFIKDKKVIDIKYQSNVSYAASDGISNRAYERSVLIMYEEEEQ